jgi:hypothetical protein
MRAPTMRPGSQFSATFDPDNKAPMLRNQMTKDAMHSLSGATRNRLIGAVAYSVAGLSVRSVLSVAAFMALCILAAHSARADDAGPSGRVETPADARTSMLPAGEKPPVAPDVVPPFATESHVAATIAFGLRALEEEIGREIPRRLVTIDERVNCVHRRVFVFRVNANCDIWGFIERSGPVSLYGRGDRLYGSLPIYGALEGQGANRFTARIRGETEARATVEVEARPQLSRDWALELNVSDGFHWDEPPVLHVLGREIALASYAEPRIRIELARVRERALAAARRLDLRAKASTAWRQAFEPIALSDNPEIWLQLTPKDAAFAGVRANAKVLEGTLALSGSAETYVGARPAFVTPTELPPLGHDVSEPGRFDVILPVRIGYALLAEKIKQRFAAAPVSAVSVRDVEVYPSSGRIVVGVLVADPSNADSTSGRWVYVSGAVQVNADGHSVNLSDFGAGVEGVSFPRELQSILDQLRDSANVDYGIAYQNLLSAANEKLTRPLKDGYRMEGHLDSAKFEKLFLSSDGIVIALRASGNLRILYGL